MVENAAGLIVAAGDEREREMIMPLTKIGSISVIKRIVLTFQQANISLILVVTGYQALEVERDLAGYGVIFLRNENYESTDKFQSVKMGLEYLQGKCKKVVYTPVNVPMYTAETVRKMLSMEQKIVIPSYRDKVGHPIVLDMELAPEILSYQGEGGLNDAIRGLRLKKDYLETEDPGIAISPERIEKLDSLLETHNQNLIHPFLRISIEKESLFFDARASLLLTLINETHSVKGACRYMAISNGKAWTILNDLEKNLGYAVVERKQGGKQGGKTYLTEEGKLFLEKYRKFEEQVKQYARKSFFEIFDEYKGQ